MYPFQGLMLLLILFIKLVLSFKDSVFSITPCIVRVFFAWTLTAFSLSCLGTLLMEVVRSDVSSLGNYLWSLAFLLYILEVIWVNYLFIRKLLTVYRLNQAQSDDRSYMHIITRTTLLNFISSSQILLFVIAFFLNEVILSIHFNVVRLLVLLLDTYTNFLSVFLSFRHYDSWYNTLCGCCHRQCHKQVTKWTSASPTVMMEKSSELQMPSSPSRSTSGDDKAAATTDIA